MLIAIMADSYEMVKEHEKVEALHERAKMIADMELLHPGWHRFSTYMHVCEAADEDSGLEPEWSGVAGRVKVLLADATQDLKSELQLEVAKCATAEDVAALQQNAAKLASDVSLVRRDTAKAADVATLREEVASLKALLLQLVDSSK